MEGNKPKFTGPQPPKPPEKGGASSKTSPSPSNVNGIRQPAESKVGYTPKRPPDTLGAEWKISASTSPAKPSAPASQSQTSNKPPAKPELNLSDVEVRTMRDDLSQVKRSGPGASLTASPAPAVSSQARTISDISARREASSKSNAVSGLPTTRPALKLSPAQDILAPQSTDEIKMPASRMKNPLNAPKLKKKGGLVKTILTTFMIILILGGAGAGAWWWFFGRTTSPVAEPVIQDTLTAEEVIPASAALVLRYNISNTDQKNAIKQAWGEASGGAPTVAGLAAGNPTLTLADPAIAEFFYVLLPNDLRTYLVLPVTAYTTQLLAEQRTVQVKEIGGWYIIHAISTDGYTSALTQGSMSLAGGLPGVPAAASLQFTMDGSFFSDFLSDLPGPIQNTITDKVISANFATDGTRLTFTNNPTGVTPKPAGETGTASEDPHASLYNAVPGDSRTVWVGQDFSQAIADYAASQGANTEILEEPSNTSLLSQLAESFAFYRRQGEDGIEDLGFVVSLPDALQSTLALGDSALESSIQSLIPVIVGSSATAQLIYSDNVYQGVPLRYINLVDSTQALDYAVTDDYLFIASSKEGMFALIDTLQKNTANLTGTAPWQSLITDSLAAPTTTHTIFTLYQDPVIAKLLPPADEGVPAQITIEPFGEKNLIQGNVAVSLPPTTPVATPAIPQQ